MTKLMRHMTPEDLNNPLMQDPAIGALIKSVPEGASTTIWAAIGKEMSDQGGLYLEDCSIAEKEKGPTMLTGSAAYLNEYTHENQGKKLWDYSLKATGL